MNTYLTKVSYMVHGEEKKRREQYLIYAETPTDAETKLVKELAVCMYGELDFRTMSVVEFAEVNDSLLETIPSGAYYKVKIEYTIMSEKKNGKPKTETSESLIYADSIAGAFTQISLMHHASLMDYEIIGITKTQIVAILR